MTIANRVENYNSTMAKLDSFAGLKEGWDLGRGEKIATKAIDKAKDLIKYAYGHKLGNSMDVIPTPSGCVLVIFKLGPAFPTLDIEVYIDESGHYELTVSDYHDHIDGFARHAVKNSPLFNTMQDYIENANKT